MKYKAFYSSESDIPADVRSLYVSRNGRWEFNGEEFEGLAEALNPGLAANRDKIKGEKKTAEEALTAEKKRADDAETELAKLRQPGTKVISKDEAEQLAKYQALGAPDDLEKTKAEHAAAVEELSNVKTEKEIRDFCEANNLDADVVVDLINTRIKGAKLITKKEKPEGGKEEVDVVYVSQDVEENGKTRTKETSLVNYVKENKIPDYITNSLFKTGDTGKTTKQQTGNTMKMPNLAGGSAKDNTVEDGKEPAQKYNEQRQSIARKMPWDKSES